MGGWWSSIIDEAIKKATEEGAFENLAGSGQPLNLTQNPYEPATMRSANRIMEQHGIAPDWIMEQQAIHQAIEKARTDIQQAWGRYQNQTTPFAQEQWNKAADAFRHAVTELNQRILTYNLKAPDISVHIAPLVLEREMERVKNGGSS